MRRLLVGGGSFPGGGRDLVLPVRHTLALVVLALGLCVTLISAWSSGATFRERLERQAGLGLARHAALVAATLDRGLYERWRDLQVMAKVNAGKLAGGTSQERVSVLDRIVATHPDYAWVGYVDRDGTVRAATGGGLVDQSVRARPWFVGGLAGMYAGDVHDAVMHAGSSRDGNAEPARLLDLAAPVRDASGDTVGVLAAHFPLSWAGRMEESLRSALQAELPGAEVLVLTRGGAVLLGPEVEIGKLWTQGWDGSGRLTHADGHTYLLGTQPTRGYRDYPGLGWSVLVRLNEATALAPVRELRQQTLAWGIAISLLAAAAAYLFAGFLKSSLDGLRSAALALGRGESVGRLPGFLHELRQIGDALGTASADVREREARLNADKARFAFALDGANDGLWDWNVETGEVWYSPRWLDMLGYAPGELAMHFSAWERLVHPDDKADVLAALGEHRQGKAPFYQAEHRLRHKQGHWVWVLTRGKIVDWNGGNRPVRAVGTHKDISDRKRVEEALRASEGCFRTLFERAPIGIAEVTPGCSIAKVNDLFCEIVGYPRDELVGKTFQEITHPDDVEADVGQVRALLGRRIPHYDMEKRYIRKDGTVVWVHLAVGLVRKEAGRPAYFLSSIKDITARKDAERARQESEAFARSVVEGSADCIKVLDLEGRVQFMNGAGLCAMEVDDFARILNGAWAGLWPAETREEIEQAVAEALRGGSARLVALGPTLRGTPKWWDVSVTPVLGSNGRPERLLAISREITDLKRAEERLHMLMGEMNHRVKNTLATVQAIVRLSARTATNIDDYKDRIFSRLCGMAKTNDLLMQGNWSGADLTAIVRSELDAYDIGGERLEVSGPPVMLQADRAVSMSMLVHEMTTNAAKYGALSTSDGRLTVSWHLTEGDEPRSLCLTWVETGGPPVTPPTRKGFGSRLIQDGLARDLQAEIQLDYRPEGLVMDLAMPLAVESRTASMATPDRPTVPAAASWRANRNFHLVPPPAESDQISYRVAFVDKDGKVPLTFLLFAPHDGEAKRKAKAMVDGYGIDLWDGVRFIEHFPPVEPQT